MCNTLHELGSERSVYQPGDCTNQSTYLASCTVLTISTGWNTLHELGTE